jgi:hypothetical protein
MLCVVNYIHSILSTKLHVLKQGILKNRLIWSLKKLLRQLRTDDDRWYWQLDFDSKLTIASLLYHMMPLYYGFMVANMTKSTVMEYLCHKLS